MSDALKKQPKPGPQQVAAISLPTWQQTMELALSCVQFSMEHLARIRAEDEDWSDDDVDVDFAVDLALSHIKRLRADPPTNKGCFDHQWFAAAAAINLSVATFSRRDCYFSRSLESLKKQFEVLAEVVDFTRREARDAS